MATVMYDPIGPRALFGFLAVAPWACIAVPWWQFHEERYGDEGIDMRIDVRMDKPHSAFNKSKTCPLR